MAAAQVSASQAVGEYLQSPDDLAKISAFRKKLEREKNSIDARLAQGVKEQLQATREGLRKLMSTRNSLQVIKDEMVSVDKECSDPKSTVATFDQISRVSIVHRNFEQTEEMVNNFMEMSNRLDQLEEMLEDAMANVIGPAHNLLAIHHIIYQLEGFRNTAIHEAKTAFAEARNSLSRYFERLNDVIDKFDRYIVALAKNILILARKYPDVVVKLVKIAELEGIEDQKAIAIKLVKKAAKLDASSKFRSVQANARIIKHYRTKIVTAIRESIGERFAEQYAQNEQDLLGFVEDLQWIYEDIIRVEDEVVQCFPEEWEIYSLYVREYHKAFNTTLKKLVESDPGASILLALYERLKEYKRNMKELKVPPELLEPPLLDGKEQSLIEDYLQVIIKKMDEWVANMAKTDLEEFTARENPPEIDADGLYQLQGGANVLFSILNQQVDSALESNQGAILSQVVAEINRVIRNLQDQWMKTIDKEMKKQSEKPEEALPGLPEYIIALANDQARSADDTEALLVRLEPLVSEKYSVPIAEKLNDAIDGYLDVATKKCVQALIDTIMNDLKPATKTLFQADWYGGTVEQVVFTMKDFMGDYRSALRPALFDMVIDTLLDSFLLVYLNGLANAPKLKMPDAATRIQDDVAGVYKFFSDYRPYKELEEKLDVVDKILGIMEASRDLVFLSYWEFAKAHGPCLPFTEGLLKSRGDLERSAVNEIMESIKRRVKEEGLTDPPEPTIMKRVMVQNAFSRFLQRN